MPLAHFHALPPSFTSSSHFCQLEDYDQTCLADIAQFDDGASLAGYDFADGFPPPSAAPHSPEQHAAAAHPAPLRLVAQGAGGEGSGGASQEQQQPVAAGAADGAAGSPPQSPTGRQLLGSPASRALDEDSLRKVAYRYRRIAKLLQFGLAALGTTAQRQEWEVGLSEGSIMHVGESSAMCSSSVPRVQAAQTNSKPLHACPPAPTAVVQALYAETDAATRGWLSHASSLLATCSSRLVAPSSSTAASKLPVTHVAVTSGQLIPSCAKLLLFRLAPHISPEHVWSSRFVGKRCCFERVRHRFGSGCAYLAIGGRGAVQEGRNGAIGRWSPGGPLSCAAGKGQHVFLNVTGPIASVVPKCVCMLSPLHCGPQGMA